MQEFHWKCRDRRFALGLRPLVMGIVNVTPDSFSDGGRYANTRAAVDRALALVAEGADILDIGGESTRPGSLPISVDEELSRVLPVVAELAERTSVPLSIDTSKAEVARECLAAGAHILNDVTGFRDAAMLAAAVEAGAGVVVMHMQGTPDTMQANPHYEDVVREVGEFFEARLQTLAAAGMPREAVCLDPGIGFGKALEHNLQLLANLDTFARLGRPVCLGVSRKGFIGTICNRTLTERMPGSLAAACIAAARGEAHVLRVHDVAPTRDAAILLEAVNRYRPQRE